MTRTLVVDSNTEEETMAKTTRPVGLAEIATMLEVAEATPTRWRYRQEQTHFPDPDGFVSNTVPWWWTTTIERWAKGTGRWPADRQHAEAQAAELRAAAATAARTDARRAAKAAEAQELAGCS